MIVFDFPKDTELRCPQCGRDDELRIQVLVYAEVRDFGMYVNPDSKLGMHTHSNCQCAHCSHLGCVHDFEVK